jgi:hypothetical protein
MDETYGMGQRSPYLSLYYTGEIGRVESGEAGSGTRTKIETKTETKIETKVKISSMELWIVQIS